MSIILGIDPGSVKTGFGIIENRKNAVHYVTSGVIKLSGSDFTSRLTEIYSGISEIVEEFTPKEVAIERVFLSKNAASALKLGHARGAAIVACGSKDVDIFEYTTREIKQAVVGTGAADKTQVQRMVKELLRLSREPSEDAADALGVAICHVNRAGWEQRLR